MSVTSLDPFHPAQCPTVATAISNGYEEARLELYFVVNGRVLAAPDGAPFAGVFQDYPGPWRAANCP